MRYISLICYTTIFSGLFNLYLKKQNKILLTIALVYLLLLIIYLANLINNKNFDIIHLIITLITALSCYFDYKQLKMDS